jgi:hypothetical protein
VKLVEALEVCRRPVAETAPEVKIFLACGFTPLHLPTFLAAALRMLQPEARVTIKTGLETLWVDEIEFAYESTPRNGPVQEFFKKLPGARPHQGDKAAPRNLRRTSGKAGSVKDIVQK